MSTSAGRRVAVVTGSSQGIGAAIAHRLATDGYHVAVVGSHDPQKAGAVVAAIEAAGGSAEPHVADISQVAEIEALIERVVERHGSVATLVNAAGIFPTTRFGTTTEADYDRVMDVNGKATYFAMNAVVPHMLRAGGGCIVNVASVAGFVGFSGLGVYGASKAAVIGMSKAAAWELGPHGIRVNVVAPGNVVTPDSRARLERPEMAGMVAQYRATTPSPRLYSSADDVAAVTAFLASEAAAGILGSVVVVDEGQSAGLPVNFLEYP